jgi:NTE family protein
MRRLDRVAIALFEGLEGEALEEVYWRLRPRHFRAGQVICRAGEPGESLLVIRQGLVHVLAGEPVDDARPGGSPPTLLARQRPGDVVGEMALLTGEPCPATLVAQLPTDAFELKRDVFLALAGRFPLLLVNLARILSRRFATQATGAGRERRAQAVAVVAGRGSLAHLGDLLAATRAASPQAVDSIDLTVARQNAQTTSEALARLEASLREGGTVVTLVGTEYRDLPLLVDYMDRVVAIVSPDELRALAERLGPSVERLELVEVGGKGERRTAGPGQARLIRGWAGDPLEPDLAWLGRHLAGTKLGLALGAGGAKGYAHVGVIRALQRAGYTIDYLAGTSIGAWVGAWLALGMDADVIERTFRAEFTTEVTQAVFRHGAAGRPSGTEVMDRVARETTAERSFESLATPLVVMAADLQGRRPVWIATGPLHAALVTGMTVPGLYPPVERGLERLVDAVVLAPVPTEALIAAGADVTVAVNLLGRETLAAWPGESPPDPGTVPPGAARDAVVEALEVAQIDAAARQAELADVPITPRFGPGTWRYFHLADRYLAAGFEATEAALPRLGELARPQRPA